MRFHYVLAGALATLVSAHADFNAPKIVGGRQLMSELKVRNSAGRLAPVSHLDEHKVVERQSTNGRCGPGVGSCTNCCSSAGYCGTGADYCAAPDCQYQFGPQCDANKTPLGASTANIPRPQLGSIPYGGTGIYNCVVPGQVAFTFDDGPYIYTSALLDKLKVYNAKATFFITGNNLGKGAIDSTTQWSDLIKTMVKDGHQIASHSWSHQDLSTLDAATFQKQMVYNEMAFNNILGYFPTYMRPPYSSCDSTCASRLKTLGYHITYFDLDTEGYLHTLPTQIQRSKDIWDNAIRTANPATSRFLEIEHDIHEQVVHNLTDYILASMYSKGFKSVTVGECLGDPKANWYRAGSGTLPSSSSSVPSSTSTTSVTPSSTRPAQAVSTDGSCSATITCQNSEFGNCCSQFGWCGATDSYCGLGCNPLSGTCGTSTVQPSSSSTTQAPPASSSSTTRAPSSSPSQTPTSTTVRPTTTTTATTTTTTRTTTTRTTTPSPVPTLKVSTDGSCGGRNRYTCTGSRFGTCCSKSGRCGSVWPGVLQPYCGSGCQPAFGVCI